MTILQSRINHVATKLGTLPLEWKVGQPHSNESLAMLHANVIARTFGWCFVYTVDVHSLQLPLVKTEYYVSPVSISHRLLKTRIKDEGVIFS